MKKFILLSVYLLPSLSSFSQNANTKARNIGYNLGKIIAVVLIILLIAGGDRLFKKKK